MRRFVLAVVLAFVLAGGLASGAFADPRCCKNQKPPCGPTGCKSGPPPTGSGGLPATGLPLYLPVLLSLGLIGTGVVIRRRTREQGQVSSR